MNFRMVVGTGALALGASVALVVAQQQPSAQSQQQPSAGRATQRATIVVYKSPT